MSNAAAMAVTQGLLLAGGESGQAGGPGVLQQAAFRTRGLAAGAPEEATCKHSRKVTLCLHD